jgi:hypothetical protein
MNKTKTPKKVKLSLDRQAVRLLTSGQLDTVVGGLFCMNDTCDAGTSCRSKVQRWGC